MWHGLGNSKVSDDDIQPNDSPSNNENENPFIFSSTMQSASGNGPSIP